MKKVYKDLIALGKKFQKYAGIDAETYRSDIEKNIWTSLKNASEWGNKGIMPFYKMVLQDGITLSFDVTRDDGFMSKNITVDNLSIEPNNKSNLLSKYEPLTQQIKDYLEKNLELFTAERNGESVDYHNFTIHLNYPNFANSPIAQK